ncbi:hypothetical protein Anas_12601 [Armadillidium nasatum]|uniref:Uncharacterized protein n=1 Tax=Armadillidium nasatum TaxID=96803 RepID=A0A5N5SSB2_9CRUS|nr:hypothetical protein Anas_12601 [Armadillidium nasatum]
MKSSSNYDALVLQLNHRIISCFIVYCFDARKHSFSISTIAQFLHCGMIPKKSCTPEVKPPPYCLIKCPPGYKCCFNGCSLECYPDYPILFNQVGIHDFQCLTQHRKRAAQQISPSLPSPNNPSCDQYKCVGARCECEIVCDGNNFCCFECGCVCGGGPKG